MSHVPQYGQWPPSSWRYLAFCSALSISALCSSHMGCSVSLGRSGPAGCEPGARDSGLAGSRWFTPASSLRGTPAQKRDSRLLSPLACRLCLAQQLPGKSQGVVRVQVHVDRPNAIHRPLAENLDLYVTVTVIHNDC